jgi:hypothetical protein
MKKIIILMGLFLVSCSNSDEKYIIRQNGNIYHTNEYKINNNCVTFKDFGCGCGIENESGVETTLCGTYSIEENGLYKQNNN